MISDYLFLLFLASEWDCAVWLHICITDSHNLEMNATIPGSNFLPFDHRFPRMFPCFELQICAVILFMAVIKVCGLCTWAVLEIEAGIFCEKFFSIVSKWVAGMLKNCHRLQVIPLLNTGRSPMVPHYDYWAVVSRAYLLVPLHVVDYWADIVGVGCLS